MLSLSKHEERVGGPCILTLRQAQGEEPERTLLAIVLDDASAMAQHDAAAGIFVQRGAEDRPRQRNPECARKDFLHLAAALVPQFYRVRKLLIVSRGPR